MPIRLLGLTVALLVAATALGVIGLGVGEAVPDHWVADRLSEALDEGLITPTAQHPTRHGNISDHFTECVGLSIGLGETSDAGLLETLAENPHLGPCDRLVPALQVYQVTGSLPEGRSYLRYWHGYSAFIRPVIAVVGVDGLRMLSFLALVGAIGTLAVAVSGVAGRPAAFGLITPLVATTDLLDLPGSSTQTISLATGMLGATVALVVVGRKLTAQRAWLVSLACGSVFVYVDLLTVVPGTWILPAAMVMLVARRAGRTTRETLGLGISSGLGWIVGYLGTWTGKWVFSAIVLGSDRVVDDVRDTIELRISGENALVDKAFGSAIEANLDRWLGRPLTITFLCIAAVVCVGVTTRAVRRNGWRSQTPVVVAALPAVVPLFWYEVTSNHSQIHEWFTYRSLPIAFGVILLAVLTRPTPVGVT